jgi:hypothetical protein
MPEMIATATPGERECLRCYLGRMLIQHGCDNTHRWTTRWRDSRAPADERLLDELSDRGGCCCDCEVVINVWEGEVEAAEPRPACRGVGSREPLELCALWAGLWLRDPDDGIDGYDEEDGYFDE